MDHDGVRWSVTGAEMCFRCDNPTGNAGRGDDSLYDPSGAGPYCHSCFELVSALAEARAEIAAKDARIAELEKALVFALRAGAYLTQKGDEIYYDTGPVTGEWKRTVGTDSDLIRVMLDAAKGE